MVRIKLTIENEKMQSFITEAYKKYGASCLTSIPDTLSVVIDDAERNLLVAYKGAFSNAPVYYSIVSGNLHCAFTVLELLESHPGCFTLNYTKIANYLSFRHEQGVTDNQTFYAEINRLLPGQSVINQDGSALLSFFTYQIIDTKKYALLTKEEHIEQLKISLTQAVKKNLQPGKKIAAHLSGGLDSSSVSSLAQALSVEPITGLHVYTDTEESEELAYAEQVSKKWPMDFKVVTPANESIASLLRITKMTGLPHTYNLPSSFSLSVLDTGKTLAIGTLLSGFLGDQLINHGDEYYDELAQNQDWIQLADLIQKNCNSPTKARRILIEYLLKRIKQKPALHTIAACYRIATRSLGYSVVDICKDIGWILNGRRQRYQADQVRKQSDTAPLLRYQASPIDSYKQFDPLSLLTGSINVEQQNKLNAVYQHLAVEAIEHQYLLFASSGIEVAYPFFNKELTELSLHSKNEWNYGHGEFRATLREAMQFYLPEAVAHRKTKASFNTYAQSQFRGLYSAFITSCKGQYVDHSVWRLVNKKVFEIVASRALANAPNSLTIGDTFIASRVIYLAIWLDYQKGAKWLVS